MRLTTSRIREYKNRRNQISIHAPRERCDKSNVYRYPRSLSISIHAPLERCDQILFTANTTTPISIHVPLARYDALGMATVDGEIADFNPHTARAVWLRRLKEWIKNLEISIHIPLARYDLHLRACNAGWRRISIHIPLARYDDPWVCLRPASADFNPHTARAVWLG